MSQAQPPNPVQYAIFDAILAVKKKSYPPEKILNTSLYSSLESVKVKLFQYPILHNYCSVFFPNLRTSHTQHLHRTTYYINTALREFRYMLDKGCTEEPWPSPGQETSSPPTVRPPCPHTEPWQLAVLTRVTLLQAFMFKPIRFSQARMQRTENYDKSSRESLPFQTASGITQNKRVKFSSPQ